MSKILDAIALGTFVVGGIGASVWGFGYVNQNSLYKQVYNKEITAERFEDKRDMAEKMQTYGGIAFLGSIGTIIATGTINNKKRYQLNKKTN